MAKLKIDSDGTSRTIKALTKGVSSGLDETLDWMLDTGEDTARDVVLATERVWRGTLKDGFSTQANDMNRSFHKKGKIKNSAPHARVVEHGLKPGNSPSVQDILPWVSTNIIPNGDAQESAAQADVSNWDPKLQKAAGEYGVATVISAFAIKGGLEKKGYHGIGFMETTERYLQQVGPIILKVKVEKHLRRELRKADRNL